MIKRQPKDYVGLFLKGAAMGSADVVPGVSGGTIAFISGIYQELLSSIGKVNIAAARLLFSTGPKAFWQHINGNFLLVLFAGIIFSAVSLAHVINHALTHYPILLWSFFFGLIAASILYVLRQMSRVSWLELLLLLFGTLFALAFFSLPPLVLEASLLTVFATAALAICAMILPGVSGSFILLVLGMYPTIIQAVTDFNLKILAVFGLGCICGLMSFSRLLSWLLSRFYNQTIAVLSGFLLGSLVIVWPWKEVVEVMMDSKGNEVVLSSRMLMPTEYTAYTGVDAMVLPAVGLMVLGFVLLLGLEYLGVKAKRQ